MLDFVYPEIINTVNGNETDTGIRASRERDGIGGWESCLARVVREDWEVSFEQILKHALKLSRERKAFQLLGTDLWLSGEVFQSERKPWSKT